MVPHFQTFTVVSLLTLFACACVCVHTWVSFFLVYAVSIMRFPQGQIGHQWWEKVASLGQQDSKVILFPLGNLSLSIHADPVVIYSVLCTWSTLVLAGS